MTVAVLVVAVVVFLVTVAVTKRGLFHTYLSTLSLTSNSESCFVRMSVSRRRSRPRNTDRYTGSGVISSCVETMVMHSWKQDTESINIITISVSLLGSN